MTRDTFLAIGACAVLLAGAGCTRTEPSAPAPSAGTSTADAPKDMTPSDPYLAEVTKFRQDREATPRELDRMRRLVAEGLEQGAVGMSSGLTYTPRACTPRTPN